MATYKVIQDIEAEDKLVGPLSLRQFIYAGICIVCLYLSFICLTKGLAPAIVLFIPPAALFGFLAFPWSGEQPTEVWALAKVNFLVKPRKRIWNQSGVKELVTVTAPKTVETTYTNGLSQSEVKSRLKALADTIDSRGWVIKNVNGPMYGQMANQQNSQRLVGIAPAMPAVEQFTENPSEDVFDAKNNPVAQKFDTMIAASEKAHRQELMDRMNAPDMPAAPAPVQAVPVAAPQAPANDYWFLNQPMQTGATVPQDTVTFNTQVVAPGTTPTALPVVAAAPTPDEEAFIKQLKNEPVISPNMHGHLHVIQPLSAQQNGAVPMQPGMPVAGAQQPQLPTDDARARMLAQQAQMPMPTMPPVNAMGPVPVQQPIPQDTPQQQVTPAPDAAILDLARNDDLNVATIAREAQKRKESPDEVVISLH